MFRPNTLSHSEKWTGLGTAWLLWISIAWAWPAEMKIIAHRGASHDAPENTIAAFKLAWSQHADGIEGDFHLTKDSRIVCIHDGNTEKAAGVNLAVAQATFAQLRTLDVGSWKGAQWAREKIPSLEEVLATVPPGKSIFIEIKCGPEIVGPLQQAVAHSGLTPEQITVISFHTSVVAAVKNQMPNFKAFWLTGYKETEAGGDWEPSLPDILQTLKHCQADGLGSHAHDRVDESFVRAIRQAGREMHVWTVDDLDQARRFQRLGVDSITTNRPDWLRQQLLGADPSTP